MTQLPLQMAAGEVRGEKGVEETHKTAIKPTLWTCVGPDLNSDLQKHLWNY